MVGLVWREFLVNHPSSSRLTGLLQIGSICTTWWPEDWGFTGTECWLGLTQTLLIQSTHCILPLHLMQDVLTIFSLHVEVSFSLDRPSLFLFFLKLVNVRRNGHECKYLDAPGSNFEWVMAVFSKEEITSTAYLWWVVTLRMASITDTLPAHRQWNEMKWIYGRLKCVCFLNDLFIYPGNL